MKKSDKQALTFVAVLILVIGFMLGYVAAAISVKPKIVEKEVIEYVEVEVDSAANKAESTLATSVPETTIDSKLFITSAYCCENYPHICNNGDASVTATGTTPTPGRTIAVDPSVIPLGSSIVIDGHTYVAEDVGGGIRGNKIDICFATHQEALNYGIQYKNVNIVG